MTRNYILFVENWADGPKDIMMYYIKDNKVWYWDWDENNHPSSYFNTLPTIDQLSVYFGNVELLEEG